MQRGLKEERLLNVSSEPPRLRMGRGLTSSAHILWGHNCDRAEEDAIVLLQKQTGHSGGCILVGQRPQRHRREGTLTGRGARVRREVAEERKKRDNKTKR